jgi:ATP-binding cassette subfamily F protein 3
MPAQLQVKNLYKAYGAQTIFDGATASFSSDQKIGVIGRNGAGKSTLCRIITGQEEMEGGEICKSADLRLSYLEQHDPFKPDETIIDFLMRYTQKAEWECAKMARRFQIRHDMLERKIKELSGGYQTRIKLAAMLLPEPNFLILDEPTNYLDLNTLILLENFLLNFDGGYLIVSHDREFLKRTCWMTLEAERGELNFYPGNVEEYLDSKEKQKDLAESHNRTLETKKKQLQTFVDRFGAKASLASLAQSKAKMIEKLDSAKIEVNQSLGGVRIKIPSVDRKHGVALRCKELSVGYPEKLVASGITMEVARGAKVAILGENGQGKTTFLRTIAGDLKAKAGEFAWGSGNKMGYYAQHVLTTLHPQDDIYHHLKKMAAPGILYQDILNMAGSFLFRGDDVEKKISVLSGGEKARVCLAGLLISKCNVLLLDEPTNHLDFETVEALARGLKQYEGTVFFISHDRTFVNLIATEIVDVKDGKIAKYPGTYEEYVYVLETKAHALYSDDNSLDDEEAPVKPTAGTKTEPSQHASSPHPKHHAAGKKEAEAPASAAKTLTYLERKDLKSDLKKLEKRLSSIDEKMGFLKTEKEGIVKQFAENPSSWSRKLNERLELLTKMIGEQENIWLELQEKIEKTKNVLGPEE